MTIARTLRADSTRWQSDCFHCTWFCFDSASEGKGRWLLSGANSWHPAQ